jgi:hypothetical protein
MAASAFNTLSTDGKRRSVSLVMIQISAFQSLDMSEQLGKAAEVPHELAECRRYPRFGTSQGMARK